jgi:GNAT superfamily N-acetyltransferase
VFTIESRPYGHPDVSRLVAELQAEYVGIYGTPDETPVEDGEFDPPHGLFLIGLADGVPVAIGGWRRLDAAVPTAEIKRMYVSRRVRGQGLSRLMLAELEATLAAAGYARVVLMTGLPQRAAISLYESSGYGAADAYGIYACAPDARFYAKPLAPGAQHAQVADRAAAGRRSSV